MKEALEWCSTSCPTLVLSQSSCQKALPWFGRKRTSFKIAPSAGEDEPVTFRTLVNALPAHHSLGVSAADGHGASSLKKLYACTVKSHQSAPSLSCTAPTVLVREVIMIVSSHDSVKCDAVLYCSTRLEMYARDSSHPLDQRSHKSWIFMGRYDSLLLIFGRRTSFRRMSIFSCSTEIVNTAS